MGKKINLENGDFRVKDGKLIIDSPEVAKAIADESIEIDGDKLLLDEEAGFKASIEF